MFQEAAYTFIYYAVPLLLTIAVEAGVAYVCGIKQRKEQRMLLLRPLTKQVNGLFL